MTTFTDAIQEIPIAAFIPLAAALIVGLLLWAAGRKVLRIGFGAVGLLVGFSLGWMLGGSLDIGIPAWGFGMVAGIVMAAIAAAMYRTALAATMAVILGIASPLALAAAYEWQGRSVFIEPATSLDADLADEFAENEPEEEDAWWENPRESVEEQLSEAAKETITNEIVPDGYEQPFEQIREAVTKFYEELREMWLRTRQEARTALVTAAVSGAVLGIVLGGLLATVSAALVTAFGGSLLWISALRVLMDRGGLGEAGILPSTSTGWLLFWIVTAFIGLGIQWMIGGREADKSG
jgi:hypothetical protein